MGAMEGLGRVFEVVPIASGVGIRLKNASAVSFVTTTAATDTFSLTIATAFAGTYRAGSFFTPAWTPISKIYRSLSVNMTAAWIPATQTAADNWVNGAGAAVTCVATLLTSVVPDPYTHVKCTAGGSGLVVAILHDLSVQRKPANLAILSAA